jgi:hypothetical protein
MLFEREGLTRPVRLIGFGVSGLVTPGGGEEPVQAVLFPEMEPEQEVGRNRRLDNAVDTLRKAFGHDAIKRGNWKAEP